MDKRVLADLISVTTKSSDKGTIFKALVKLRAEFVKDKHGIQTFYEAGGIAPMVRLLSKPYEKILEVALSILGNCCTQKACSKQAISNGIVPPLLTILKSIPNPKVQCRVCRLLGNLARESNTKLCSLAKGIGVVVASVLEDTKDVSTLGMAVRATRLLWNEMPFNQEFVRSDGVDKILSILVQNTIVEQCKRDVKSIVEQNPYESGRVEFMLSSIPMMELINSRAFDQEILKKSKPIVDDGFRIPIDPEQHNLVLEILKCLETVTAVPTLQIIYNFISVQHCGSCITFFARGDSPYRAHALKVLSNLAKSSGQRILNEADAMTTVCNLITAVDLNKALSSSEERHCICVICFLADDSCNRAKVRTSGAFKHLLQVAKNTDSDSLLTMILIGLRHFRYDNLSTDLMIHMGLLNVLMNRLKTSIKDLKESHNTERKKTVAQKRTHDDDEGDDMEMIFPKRVKVEITPSRYIPGDIDSPSTSCSGSIYYSPSNSPASSSSPSPRSLSPANRSDSYYDDIDDYSPVVSDIEDQNDDEMDSKAKSKRNNEIDRDNNDILQKILNEQSASKCELEEENVSDQGEHDDAEDVKEKEKKKEPNSQDISEKKQTVNLMLGILCNASYRLKELSTKELCKPDILDTLLQTCRLTYKRRSPEAAWDAYGAPQFLSQIIDSKNFVDLLKSNFIFKVYDMANPVEEHENCDLCSDLKFVGVGLLNLLSETAENGYGRGEMVHYLLKNDKQMHKQVSVISALIIRDKRVLHTLLIKHGGFYTMIEMILTKGEQLANEAATGLTALARTLGILPPKYDDVVCEISKFDAIVGGDYFVGVDDWMDDESLVTFISGSQNDAINESNTVRFSERILTETSDVFNRMFNSDFQESKNKQVILKNQSIEGIRYFLNCVQQHSMGRTLQTPVIKIRIDNEMNTQIILKAALEAYDMCHIYLLPELEKKILNHIITNLLSATNILELFIFSMKNHRQELTEMSIKQFLTSNWAAHEKVKVFQAADDCEFCKEWNDLILDTIVYTCQNHLF